MRDGKAHLDNVNCDSPILLLQFCDKFVHGFRSRLGARWFYKVFWAGAIFRISVRVAGHSENYSSVTGNLCRKQR